MKRRRSRCARRSKRSHHHYASSAVPKACAATCRPSTSRLPMQCCDAGFDEQERAAPCSCDGTGGRYVSFCEAGCKSGSPLSRRAYSSIAASTSWASNANEPSIVARGSLAHSAARARPAPLLLKLLGGSQPHSQSRPSLDFGRDRNILVHVKTRAERTTTWIF